MFKMSDRAYGILKWGVILFIPAIGIFYSALASIWNLPLAVQIQDTLDALSKFLAVVLGISCASYQSSNANLRAEMDSIVEKYDRKEEVKQEEEKKEEKPVVVTDEEPKKEELKVEEEPIIDSSKKKIYLSPSNQYDNLYAYGNIDEATNCEHIASILKSKLEDEGYYVVVGSRDKSMEVRCEESNNLNVDIHMPIHTNAFNGEVGGTRIFYKTDKDKEYAQKVYDSLAPVTVGTSDNMSYLGDLYELNHVNAPSVYVEVDFHDVPDIAKWLIENRVDIAEALCKGIVNALEGKVEETPVVVNKTEEEREIGGTCICKAGGEYYLSCNVKIRESYGTDARWKDYSELSEDGKKHAVAGDKAVLASGTSITCLEVYKNWIRIPSGWMCARDLDGTDNVKVGSDKWCYPVNYVGVSTGFSYDHMAYDYGWNSEHGGPNCPIYSPCDGEVVAVDEAGTAGKYIYIITNKDGQDYTFRFCHLSKQLVSVGQKVSRHQQIGNMGGTGGFDPHLHMDLWKGIYRGVMPSDRWAACINYMLKPNGEGHELLFLDSGQIAGDTTGKNYVFHSI